MNIRKVIGCGILFLCCNASLYAQCDGAVVEKAFMDVIVKKMMEEARNKGEDEAAIQFAAAFIPQIMKIKITNAESLSGWPFGQNEKCKANLTISFDPSALGQEGKAEQETFEVQYGVTQNQGKTIVEPEEAFWEGFNQGL